jgi:ribonuclease J
MVKITFFGGVNEIGGNKFLLEDKKTRIFLDFGLSFNKFGEYFAEFIQPRSGSGVGDYLELGLIPRMKGIYRKDFLKPLRIKSEEKSVDAVLISHSHFDHMGLLDMIRNDIEVRCSEESKKIMEIFDQTMSGEFLKQTPKFRFYVNTKGEMSRWTKKQGQEDRDLKTFKPGKSFDVGDFTITPFQVDHSLPGAIGYVIETPEKTVVYTGDLRFHGRYPEYSNYFVEKASEFEPDVMLCEGTRVEEYKNNTEEWVEKTAKDIISDCKGLVIVNYPSRDISRILTFFNIAEDTDRKLVVDFKQALLLKVFGEMGYLPKMDDVMVYAQPKSWFLINDENAPERQIPIDYETWERDFLELDNLVKTKDIRENQEDYVFFCSNFSIGNLIDLKPVDGSIYIRSMCEPLDDESAIDEERINKWYDHFGINEKRRHQIHCSGHACGPDLKGMIGKIDPKNLIPIHTEKAEIFKKLNDKVHLLKEVGEVVEIK